MRRLLLGLGIAATFAAIAGAQVTRTPQFGDSFIRDQNTPSQYATVGADNALAVNNEGRKASYSASVSGLVAASTATDVFVIYGSASKTIRITRLAVAGRATAAITSDITINKRVTAPSGGTSVLLPGVAHDSTSSAATASVSTYTANPTVGSGIGGIRTGQINYGNLTTTASGAPLVWDFGARAAVSTVILRGAAQGLAVTLPASSPSGNLLDIDVEWTEE